MKLNNNDDSHNSGLNLLIYNMLLDIESHPAWVCGLKRITQLNHIRNQSSHPAWVCGLKRTQIERRPMSRNVTPCVGVWIETKNPTDALDLGLVTPCVGVWIETYGYNSRIDHNLVTPCVGVWIETRSNGTVP